MGWRRKKTKHRESYHVKSGTPIAIIPNFPWALPLNKKAKVHGDPADDGCSCNEDFDLVVKNDLQVLRHPRRPKLI